ncbi:MAG TPA: GTPase domain-containing protein [Sphingobacteriaceae bacterium]|nr:GTPase domain-containing protein [Sphingobacteriaceae bacterium]
MTAAKDALVIGRPNVGKTLFLLNFALYCGVSSEELVLRGAAGDGAPVVPMTAAEARERLVSPHPNETRHLQSIVLELPRRKQRKKVSLWDSTGLTDTIHQAPEVRLAMAETLRALRDAQLILHFLDAALIGEMGEKGIGAVDHQVAAYAPLRGAYVICANKMDLPQARAGLGVIRRTFPGRRVLPVSALRGTGFREVLAFVWDHL